MKTMTESDTMTAPPRPFAIEVIDDAYCVVKTSPYVQHGEVTPEALIVARCESQDDAALIVKAVNTHERAKAAIKAVLHEYDKASMFDANGSKFDEIRAVLADMEG